MWIDGKMCGNDFQKKQKIWTERNTFFSCFPMSRFRLPPFNCSLVRVHTHSHARTHGNRRRNNKKNEPKFVFAKKKRTWQNERESRDTDWMKKSSRNNKRTTALSSVSFFFAVFQQKKRESTNNKKRIKDVEMRTKNDDRRCGWFFLGFPFHMQRSFFLLFFSSAISFAIFFSPIDRSRPSGPRLPLISYIFIYYYYHHNHRYLHRPHASPFLFFLDGGGGAGTLMVSRKKTTKTLLVETN